MRVELREPMSNATKEGVVHCRWINIEKNIDLKVTSITIGNEYKRIPIT